VVDQISERSGENPVAKGRMTCGTVEVACLVGREWLLRRGRMRGRLGEAVQSGGGNRFSVQSGRRFVVTKSRRAKGAE